MDKEVLRKEFEEWEKNKYGHNLYSYYIRFPGDGTYVHIGVQAMWIVWLESARRADRRAREECAVIAKTQKVIGWNGFDAALGISKAIRATIKEE